jgi:hypothetical protein
MVSAPTAKPGQFAPALPFSSQQIASKNQQSAYSPLCF